MGVTAFNAGSFQINDYNNINLGKIGDLCLVIVKRCIMD